MTTIEVAGPLAEPILSALVSLSVRLPDIVDHRPGAPAFLSWTSDLSTAERATVDSAIGQVRAFRPMPAAEYDALRSHMQTIRDLRQMGRNAFMALTAAERDRLLYDAQAATTTILLALLRE